MIELIWLASALSDGAWLDALLRAALRGSVLLLAAGAAALLLRRASAAARHLVWATAFAGLLALPVLPALVPALEVPLPRAAHVLLDALELEAPELPELEIPFTVEVAADPDPDPLPDPDPDLDLLSEASGAALDASRTAAAEAAAAGTPVEVHRGEFSLGWAPVLLAAWAAGAAALLLSLLVGVLRTRGEDARAQRVLDGPPAELLERLRAEAGVRRPVTLLRGDASAMPATWGVLRPRILLPAGAERWPADRLRAVLLHELAHVRRCDRAVLLAAEAACALYWFNPLAWAAAHRLRAESEHACDDQVLRAGSRPSDYAGHLLEVARTLRAPRSAPAGAIAMARPAQLRGRLLAVLAEERRRGPVPRRLALPVLLAGSLAVALLAALSPASGVQAAPADAVEAALAAPAAGAAAASPAEVGPLESAPAPGSPAPAAETSPVSAVAATKPRCADTGGFSRHEHVDDDGRREAAWHNQRGCGGRLESAGRVRYTADSADVAEIAPGGRFVVELYDRGGRRRAELTPAEGGLRRAFTVDGRARPWDAEARRWLAGALAEYFEAMTPPPAPPAPPVPGRRGGEELFPEEATSGERAAALKAAAEAADGDTELLRRVVRESRRVDSDGDRTAVLLAVAAHAGGSPPVLREVLAASRGIGSSGDRARLLLAISASEGLPPGIRLELLGSLDGLASQGDRARVLGDFVERHGLAGGAERDAWFAALDRVGSGGTRRDLLLAALRRPGMDPSGTRRVIRAAEDIDSSADRAAVLAALADRGLVADAVREDFLRAARGITSSQERERVLARPGARAADAGRAR
ncbi:MAG TPA: M56 family metallopeptidase [Longimicrobiaceae bacterium]|jgi:beta-lactamase regulating signal transducer with metallopeptidase domain